MCGRFSLFASPKQIADQFDLPELPNIEPRYNIAPSQDIGAVSRRADKDHPTWGTLRWGLIPFWGDDPADFKANLINARAETVHEKPSFREPFKKRRCIIPASGFYEWQKQNGSQPYFVRPDREDELFGFAGLWDTWKDEEAGTVLHSATIITTDDPIKAIHDRAPVILEKSDYSIWLDPTVQDKETLLPLLDLYPEDRVRAYPVSTKVNRANVDEPACVEPMEK